MTRLATIFFTISSERTNPMATLGDHSCSFGPLFFFCGCGGTPQSNSKKFGAGVFRTPDPTANSVIWQFHCGVKPSPGKALPITFCPAVLGPSRRRAVKRGRSIVDGSNCFDRSTTIGLTSTVNWEQYNSKPPRVMERTGHHFHREFRRHYLQRGHTKSMAGCAAGRTGKPHRCQHF